MDPMKEEQEAKRRDAEALAEVEYVLNKATSDPQWTWAAGVELYVNPSDLRRVISMAKVQAAMLAADRDQEASYSYLGSCSTERREAHRGFVGPDPGSPLHVALWSAVNAYAQACGGNTGRDSISEARILAVCDVEDAVRAYAMASCEGSRR